MKIPENVSDFNPINLILSLLPHKEPIPLKTVILDQIGSALALGKIECETREEIIKCLEVLASQGILSLSKKEENDGVSYLIGNLYNGV